MTHPHHDHAAHDWQPQLESLEREGQVAQHWVGDAVDWLANLSDTLVSRVIDVGSGPGYATTALAQRFAEAQVTAVDPTPEFLDRAMQRAQTHGVEDRVSTHRSTLDGAVGVLPEADLVWASHVVHHLPDPVEGLREIRALLRPGGVAAVIEGGLPMRVLPGGYGVGSRSFLGRLEAATNDYFTHEWSLTDQAVGGAADWPVLMADAGFADCRTRTFLLDLPAPLDDVTRKFVVAHFEKTNELLAERLEPGDAKALSRLVDPDDPASLHRRSDVFLLSAASVHVGINPQP